MRRRPCRYIVLVFTALAVVSGVTACGARAPRLETINEEQIPQAIRDHVARGPHRSDVTWHVYEVKGDRIVAACTLSLALMGGTARTFWIGCFDRVGDYYLLYGDLHAGTFPPEKPFVGGYNHGSASGNLFAAGVAIDGRIAKIVGTTSDGREVASPRYGLFWALRPDPMPSNAEQWVSIRAVDKAGNVLHELPVRSGADDYPTPANWGEPEFAQPLDPTIVPARVRAAIVGGPLTDPVNWYAYREWDGHIFVACTAATSYTPRPPEPDRKLVYQVLRTSEGGSPVTILSSHATPLKQPPEEFISSWGFGGDPKTSGTLRATGIVTSPGADKVIGRTVAGTVVEFVPVAGFWALWVEGVKFLPDGMTPADSWAEIVVFDAAGVALHSWRPRMP